MSATIPRFICSSVVGLALIGVMVLPVDAAPPGGDESAPAVYTVTVDGSAVERSLSVGDLLGIFTHWWLDMNTLGADFLETPLPARQPGDQGPLVVLNHDAEIQQHELPPVAVVRQMLQAGYRIGLRFQEVPDDLAQYTDPNTGDPITGGPPNDYEAYKAYLALALDHYLTAIQTTLLRMGKDPAQEKVIVFLGNEPNEAERWTCQASPTEYQQTVLAMAEAVHEAQARFPMRLRTSGPETSSLFGKLYCTNQRALELMLAVVDPDDISWHYYNADPYIHKTGDALHQFMESRRATNPDGQFLITEFNKGTAPHPPEVPAHVAGLIANMLPLDANDIRFVYFQIYSTTNPEAEIFPIEPGGADGILSTKLMTTHDLTGVREPMHGLFHLFRGLPGNDLVPVTVEPAEGALRAFATRNDHGDLCAVVVNNDEAGASATVNANVTLPRRPGAGEQLEYTRDLIDSQATGAFVSSTHRWIYDQLAPLALAYKASGTGGGWPGFIDAYWGTIFAINHSEAPSVNPALVERRSDMPYGTGIKRDTIQIGSHAVTFGCFHYQDAPPQ